MAQIKNSCAFEMEVNGMKKIKYFVLAMAAMFLFSSTDYVYASEVESLKAVQAVAEVGARTVKTFRFGTSKTTYTVGMQAVYDDSTLTLTMPRNNGRSLVQGTIYFIPDSGSQININFANYSTEVLEIDMSRIPSGVYYVKIGGVAVGTASTVDVTYNFN